MSEIKASDSDQNVNIRMEKRDGETYVALGLFIVAVGIPVVIGTYFAAQTNMRAAIVNIICAGVLLLIGVAAITYGRILLARNKRRS
ncbi:MAG TPA: hypothetical protein PLI09_03645 [Candidatus Hydrogenedentes bacterium]|nr:hypothetical protein [Candidatus Hydrogenedentota bacterium]